MRALRSFTVRVRLPEPLVPLQELATNLRWSWDEATQDLFRWVDPAGWETAGHDPLQLLAQVRPERLEALATDPAFLAYQGEVQADLHRYLRAPRWFQNRQGGTLQTVAYFSPEFGVSAAIPQYSGGLGVLAGDHLKAAGNLGVPLVGVGLLYRYGYFRQAVSPDGWQEETYPCLDPHTMGVRPVEGLRVSVDLAGAPVVAQVWRADVGRVPLYLLDTDLEENDAQGRAVTDRLYGGDTEHRLRQEILLGIGGLRALAALEVHPEVLHTNEGHAGFLGLERIASLMGSAGLSFEAALETTRAGGIFTTHTPVPAGIDRFSRPLMERYFAGWCEACGINVDRLMALGHFPDDPPDAPFNTAVMCLRLAGSANGVSTLHGRVSRGMFASLWPGIDQEEIPIGSVTNGVHGLTWTSQAMHDLVGKAVVPAWTEAEAAAWEQIEAIPDDHLWRVRTQGRERLVQMVRAKLRSSLAAAGDAGPELDWCDEALDPGILTIGFARRFTAYKRPTLLLSDRERLTALLTSTERPVQVVFAGKAHPADEVGKQMIQEIVQFSRDPAVRHRVAFVEDYGIGVAQALYQGCDLWLNTPRRPQEASGTSGMKVALNGGLNCSVLDGWWDEMWTGDNGWAISSAEDAPDQDRRDAVEAARLFDLLEQQVVPLFYDRPDGALPTGWLRRIKASLQTLGPQVVASRMVRQYTEAIYEPAARRAASLCADGYRGARDLAAWKARVRDAWPQVEVEAVEAEASSAELGAKRRVEAVISLGELGPSDVAVQLLHGPVGDGGELARAGVVDMAPAGTTDSPGGEEGGRWRYAGAFACTQAGRHGFTVRILPSHEGLAAPTDLGLVAWA